MTVKHHPSEAVLIAYAAGALGEGLALLVATHLSFCPACRRAVAEAEAVGGALLENIPPVPLRSGALDDVLARLNGPAPPACPPRRPDSAGGQARGETTAAGPGIAGLSSRLPGVLRPYLDDLGPSCWQWLAPGIRQIELFSHGALGDSARLLHISPGRLLPHHGHAGLEMTVVLSGSFADEQGRFTQGDLAEMDIDGSHQPIADSAEGCLCLVGTNAPLRFSGLMPRLMAPFLGL